MVFSLIAVSFLIGNRLAFKNFQHSFSFETFTHRPNTKIKALKKNRRICLIDHLPYGKSLSPGLPPALGGKIRSSRKTPLL
jgi:hypothetical protein